MKVKYKIYPLPNGEWRAEWDFDEEQAAMVKQVEWYSFETRGPRPPKDRQIFFFVGENRVRERRKLEKACEWFAAFICRKIKERYEEKHLKEAAPVIEHGCSS